MKTGLFPGTFDPPTLGHIKLIKRAASLCDQLIVGVGENPAKSPPILSPEERVACLKSQLQTRSNVKVTYYSGLTTSFAKNSFASLLIRGIRWGKDLEYEIQMATANRQLGFETIFLVADPSAAAISSTLIRQLAAEGAPLRDYLPKEIEDLLYKRLKEKK